MSKKFKFVEFIAQIAIFHFLNRKTFNFIHQTQNSFVILKIIKDNLFLICSLNREAARKFDKTHKRACTE